MEKSEINTTFVENENTKHMALEFETTTWRNVGEEVQYSYDTPPEFKTEDVQHFISVELVKHEGDYVIEVWDRLDNLDHEYQKELTTKLEEFIVGKMSFIGDEVWIELENGIAVYDTDSHKGKHMGWEIIKAFIIDELNDYTHEG